MQLGVRQGPCAAAKRKGSTSRPSLPCMPLPPGQPCIGCPFPIVMRPHRRVMIPSSSRLARAPRRGG